MTGNRYVVIHGHFYQPPRENPWLDIIEEQESAAPYHDWNERIYDECYRPNAYSRLLDAKGMIAGIHNNYLNMSYNFGPTLFTWMERYHPVTARKVIAADKESAGRLGGHGNAVAQVFNHIIMPLSGRRDQLTQIRWAKHFFRKRYGRDPEGMWLGEAAINMETVVCLIEEKIGYVVLSPNQAESYRRIGDGNWTGTGGAPIDTRRPYRVFPRARDGAQLEGHLDVFFFDEALSKAVSFDNLLQDSRTLGNSVNERYDRNNGGNQLVTIATDGETFGHHKPYGDMCLAYFFTRVAPEMGITPVNFGYYLSINPPEYEVSLGDAFGEGRSWSCAHGVGRWSRDCGCQTGGKPGWNQAWRGPLRQALRGLQSQIDFHFEARLSTIFADPWALRDKYINVMWEPSLAKMAEFLHAQSGHKFAFGEELTAEIRRLLEAQKFMLFSFTSCGWFFCELSGIETVQNLAYACRALQLGLPEDSKRPALEAFLDDLSKAPSNISEFGNGRRLFEMKILPFYHHEGLLAFTAAAQQILAVKRHSLYEKTVYNLELKSVMSYRIDRLHYDTVAVRMESGITGESSAWSVLIAHGPETELLGWVLPAKCVPAGNGKPDVYATHPDVTVFTLSDLFYSSRGDLSGFFLDRMSKDTDSRFLGWMEENEHNLNVLSRLRYPVPAYCSSPVGYVLQNRWDAQIHKLERWGSEESAAAEMAAIDDLSGQYAVPVDKKRSALTLQNTIIKALEMLQQRPAVKVCDRLRGLMGIVDKFAVPVSKSKLEDFFHPVHEGALNDIYQRHREGNCGEEDKELLTQLINIARRMNFNTDKYAMQ
jgi:alpha-amylase/alpha-mannosidase (GH57 family)